MDAWLARLVKIRIPGHCHGTGWALGAIGILTARSVIEPLLTPAAELGLAEVVLGSAPDRSFAAFVVWSDEARDLAVLSISERHHTTWQTVLRAHPQGLLARPRSEDLPPVAVCGVAPPAGEASSMAWMLAPTERIDGVIDPTNDASVDVARADTSRAVTKRGFAGAAVLAEESEPMLLGIVTGRPRGRRRVRFEFSVVPDPAEDPAFATALEAVRAEPTVYHMDGPLLRSFVTPASLDKTLSVRRVRDIDGPGWFGTHPARRGAAPGPEPFGPYITRPERAVLADALSRAIAGTGPRVIVVRGPAAAGKSRLVAEVVRAHPELADYRILAPRRDAAILELPERLRAPRTVVFLDDLGAFPALALRHDLVRRDLERHPHTILLATVTDPPDPQHGLRLIDRGPAAAEDDPGPIATGLSPTACVIDDDCLAVTVSVAARPTWSPRGRDEDAAVAALAAASRQGLGLGEYLTGYDLLADHYTAARWPARVLVEMAADWARSGIGRPMPPEVARQLWQQLVPASLPRDELLRFQRLTPAETERQFSASLSYVDDPVAPSGALVQRIDGGLAASMFARVHIDRGAIGAAMWEHLLAAAPTTPATRLDLGLRALASGTPQRALRAFESILFFRDSDPAERDRLVEVVARRGIAVYHAMSGRTEQAIMVFTDLVDTFGPDEDADIAEQVALALLGIGHLFSELGSDGQAASALTELVDRYRNHPSPILERYVAAGLRGQAGALGRLGRHDEERAAYEDIVSRYGADDTVTISAIVDAARRALDN